MDRNEKKERNRSSARCFSTDSAEAVEKKRRFDASTPLFFSSVPRNGGNDKRGGRRWRSSGG